jgi:hypothetical protein
VTGALLSWWPPWCSTLPWWSANEHPPELEMHLGKGYDALRQAGR